MMREVQRKREIRTCFPVGFKDGERSHRQGMKVVCVRWKR
jgi:hypothetical protein